MPLRGLGEANSINPCRSAFRTTASMRGTATTAQRSRRAQTAPHWRGAAAAMTATSRASALTPTRTAARPRPSWRALSRTRRPRPARRRAANQVATSGRQPCSFRPMATILSEPVSVLLTQQPSQSQSDVQKHATLLVSQDNTPLCAVTLRLWVRCSGCVSDCVLLRREIEGLHLEKNDAFPLL